MKKSLLFLLSVLTLLQTACRKTELMPLGNNDLIVSSTQIVPEAVFMDLQLEYDGVRNKTTATATFIYRNPFDTLDGARVRLNSWNAVTFNGTVLPEQSGNAIYRRTFNGYVPEGDFVWTSWVLITYTNHARLPSADFPQQLPVNLQQKNYRVAWQGSPVDTTGLQEEVGLVVRKVTPAFWTSVPGDTAVTVSKDKMDNLKEKIKWGQAFWQRTSEQPLQQGTILGGRIRTLYESECRDVEDVLDL